MATLLRSILALALILPGVAAQDSKTPVPDKIQFNRDIRPILSENCLKCHGPDAKKREANLRFDQKEGAFKEIEKGHFAIVPASLERSEMWKRITSKDRDEVMPPPKSGKKLIPREIALVKKWIEQGADWQGHWAFTPVQPPPLLKVRDAGWPRDPLDSYVLARLEEEGLKPSPETDRRTLARRITLDLTGLPPTPEEVDAFVNDRSPGAYEKFVDRLLASPRYGEHMARFWLDLARYGDTHGLHLDNYREMWPYRDWVIRAFNENLAFDKFVTWQLAGDLLPDATIDQQVASGFNRCHVTTNEGGSIEEEVYCRNVFDRVETFGQVFFALTFTCTRCHDHKYDPITQKDYYGLFAYFNSLDGQEMDGNRKDPTPVIKVPSPTEAKELARLRDGASQLETRMNGPVPEVDPGQHDWEQATSARLAAQWSALEASLVKHIVESQPKKADDKSVQAGEPKSRQLEITTKIPAGGVHALLLEVLPPDPEPAKETSLAFTVSEAEAELVSGGKAEKVAFRVAIAYGPAKDANTKNLIDGKPDTGWAGDARKRPAVALIPQKPIVAREGTELRVRLVQQGAHAKNAVSRVRLSVGADAAFFTGTTPATFGPWHVLGRITGPEITQAFDTDFGPEQGVDLAKSVGEIKWTKREDLVNGKDQEYPSGVGVSYLYRTVTAPSHRKLTFSIHNDDAVLIWLNGSVVLSRNAKRGFRKYDANKVTVELEPGENRVLVKFVNYGTAGGTGSTRFNFDVVDEDAQDLHWDLADAVSAPPAKRTDAQKALLRTGYRRERWAEWGALSRQVARLRGEETELLAQMPITMVFKERPTLREAFILKRGEYDKRGDKITRATPAFLPPPAKELPVNRLGLAKWVLDPSHPLTARVAVNRFWQQFFGIGIVKTSEDYGSQGQPPSHFDLLDHLAAQFVADGWDVKEFMKRVAMSSTYRQSSKLTPELVRRDPENRLYARGPRFRLDAEMLRDQALYLSGLLVETVGGASVKPPQPEGLWEAVGYTGSNTYRFQRDPEPKKVFRRSMYIFWKRTSAPPMMTLFDAPSREACTARRERTNTPLQALMLMNEPQYVEAARHLAQRAIKDGGATPEERVAWMVRLCTLRPASPADVKDLVGAYKAQLEIFSRDPEGAKKTVTYGDLPADATKDAPELAAWTLVASVLLNLDEVLNKR